MTVDKTGSDIEDDMGTPTETVLPALSINELRELILRRIIRVACAVGAAFVVLSSSFANPFEPVAAIVSAIVTVVIFSITLLPARFRILSVIYPWALVLIGLFFLHVMGPRNEVFIFFCGGLFIASLVFGGRHLLILGAVTLGVGVALFLAFVMALPSEMRGIWYNSTTAMIAVMLPAIIAGRMIVRALERTLMRQETLLRKLVEESKARELALRTLEKTRAQLTHAQKVELIGQMAGGIAHDMNNALAVVMGEASLLDDSMEQVREHILDAAEYAGKLTRQLMVFGRRDTSQPRPMDLSVNMRSMLKAVRRVIPSEIVLNVELPETPVVVIADSTQLLQVLLNLATNARDVMPTEGGRLAVSLRQVDNRAIIEVADNGSGISDDLLPQIFEPFFTTKPVGQGTGLGLANVKQLVDEMGGTVSVSSIVGEGTVFTIQIPVSDAEIPAVRRTSISPQRRFGTILVVDDDVRVRAVVYTTLERVGFEVLEAATPEAALQVANEHLGKIDLLLTDVVMPGGGGIGAIRGITSQHPHVKILVMSGYNDDETLRRGISLGEFPFIAKPFTADDLVHAVDSALQS